MLETFCMFLAPRLERSRTRTSSYAIKILPARSISEISLPRRDLCGPQPAPGALSSHVLPMPSSSLRSSPALVRSAAFDITLLNSQETLSINHSLNHLWPPCALARACRHCRAKPYLCSSSETTSEIVHSDSTVHPGRGRDRDTDRPTDRCLFTLLRAAGGRWPRRRTAPAAPSRPHESA